MSCSREQISERTEWSAADSLIQLEIARFQGALHAIAAQLPSGTEPVLDALLDFFACRCRNTRHLHRLGAGLFTALDKQASCSITAGVFDEEFTFRREHNAVQIAVDEQQLAQIPLDLAIRLATLLHGARHSTTGRKFAA